LTNQAFYDNDNQPNENQVFITNPKGGSTMEDAVKCPACEVENPKSRATCQVCHAPLRKKTKDTGGKSTEAGNENAGAQAAPVTGTKNPPDGKNPAPAPKIPDTPKLKPSSPKAKKRRSRQRSKKSSPIEYFKLEDGHLLPIYISLKIKPLKRKEAKDQAKALISFWNRNRLLIS
jgi:hypothetical protein